MNKRNLMMVAAAMAFATPLQAMNYEGARLSVNVVDLRTPQNVPAFPADIVVCEEGDAPGVDCNCIDGDEDSCATVAWTSCDTDTDCEIRSRSPYGWQPFTEK
jgi:hypothetical protein